MRHHCDNCEARPKQIYKVKLDGKLLELCIQCRDIAIKLAKEEVEEKLNERTKTI